MISRMARSLERLLQHRQHLEPVLLADALDVLEHRRAAVAHQLHEAEDNRLAERDHRFDGVGGFERDIEEDELGVAAGDRLAERCAVGEFLGVDAGAMQDQRQEMADARFVVDDEAERHARGCSGGIATAGAPAVPSDCALRSKPSLITTVAAAAEAPRARFMFLRQRY